MRHHIPGGGLEVADYGQGASARTHAVLERLRAGLGQCACGTRATTLQQGPDGPAQCAICAEEWRLHQQLDADLKRIARHDQARAVAARDAERARAGRRTIVGYPVIYGQEYQMPDGTIETVEYKAAGSSLAKGGLTLVLDHDDHRVLARQADGTLRLKENHFGLFVEADIAESDDARIARLLVAGSQAAGSWKGRPLVSRSAPPLQRQTVRELNLIHLSIASRSRAAYKSTWFDADGPVARRRALRCEADAIERVLLEAEVSL